MKLQNDIQESVTAIENVKKEQQEMKAQLVRRVLHPHLFAVLFRLVLIAQLGIQLLQHACAAVRALFVFCFFVFLLHSFTLQQ